MEVLVVDDSFTIRFALRTQLNALGCNVTVAENGLEALRILTEGKPMDICLVDWNMPVMDGLQLLKTLKARNHPAADKIMMVTTESEPEQIMKALEAGAKEYLMKPITIEALVSKLSLMGWDLDLEGGEPAAEGA